MDVLRLAWCNTIRSFGGWRSISGKVILFAFGFGFLFLARGEEKFVNEFVNWVFLFLAPAVAVLVLTFLWNLWLAPYRMIKRIYRADIERINSTLQDIRAGAWQEDADLTVEGWASPDGTITVLQAARLWEGVKPQTPAPVQASERLNWLKDAIKNRTLGAHISSSGLGNENVVFAVTMGQRPPDETRVLVAELRQYAASLGLLPKFLE